jgi:hypothetical protein
MSAARVAQALLAAGTVAGVAWWALSGHGGPPVSEGGPVDDAVAPLGGTPAAAASSQGAMEMPSRAPGGAPTGRRQQTPPSGAATTASAVLEVGTSSPRSWPVPKGSATTAVSNVEPAVPVRLAFRALWYLGVDPAAERTWIRAINDLSLPAGVRSDLIVDMIDEGYSDNSRPGVQDLPLILARLQIIERHAPYATDPVNRAAFEEIYRDLLELYIRLGGVLPEVR